MSLSDQAASLDALAERARKSVENNGQDGGTVLPTHPSAVLVDLIDLLRTALRASPSPSAGAVPAVWAVQTGNDSWSVRAGDVSLADGISEYDAKLVVRIIGRLPHADAGGEARPMAYDCDGCDGAALHHYCIRCLDAKSDAAAEAARREERETWDQAVRTALHPCDVATVYAKVAKIRDRAAEREKTETSEEAPAITGSQEGDGPVRAAGTTPKTAAPAPPPCPDCAGTLVWSKSNHDHRPCPRCMGEPYRGMLQCPACSGTGRAPASSPAPAAHDDEDPGRCLTCGKAWELVRPGKSQPTCSCDDAPAAPGWYESAAPWIVPGGEPTAPEARGEAPPVDPLWKALQSARADGPSDKGTFVGFGYEALTQAVREYVAAERALARDAALEEAAKVAEEWGPANLGPDKTIARRIRSLRGTGKGGG